MLVILVMLVDVGHFGRCWSMLVDVGHFIKGIYGILRCLGREWQLLTTTEYIYDLYQNHIVAFHWF